MALVMIALAGFVPPSHLYLERKDAIDVLQRWKPQSIGGHLVSVTGAQEYTRARLQLERTDRGAFAVVDDNNEIDLFVVAHHSVQNRTTLHAVMWHSPCVDKHVRFRNLHLWYTHTFPGCALVERGLTDKERGAWR